MTPDMATAPMSGPRGHYLANDAGQLAGVSGQTIGQWARRGYIRASHGVGYPHVYAYQDVAEAMVVHELIDQGVNLRFIRRALEELRKLVGTDWPLQNARLLVPQLTNEQLEATRGHGRTVGVEHKGTILDLVKGHAVLPESDLVAIADDLSRGGWAARELKTLQHIEVNPDRLSGQPTIRGRRIFARQVAEMAGSITGVEELKEGFNLRPEEIEDARLWWSRVESYQAAA
jgi:uncharacterized protein (DUF433 family)/DNA-binding transcriptional MerR regulator